MQLVTNQKLLMIFLKYKKFDNIKIVNTGINSETGERIKKLKSYLEKEKIFY